MTVTFYHINAFTTEPFAGNPAVVTILENDTQFKDDNLLQKLGSEWNMPATAFLLSSSTGNDATAKYRIKWFDPIKPIPICGHGTLAASHVIFSKNKEINSIEYDAGPAGFLTAQRGVQDSIVLDFPACKVVGMQEAGQAIKSGIDLERVIKSLLADDVKIEFIGRGDRGGYVDLVLVDLAENYPLKEAKLNNDVLEVLLPEIRGIILTTRSSSDASSHIHSRCIHTEAALGEDSATGSAHCVLAPYWSEKLRLDAEDELKAAQVSKRGGKMALVWRREDMRILIRCSAVTLATGTMSLGV